MKPVHQHWSSTPECSAHCYDRLPERPGSRLVHAWHEEGESCSPGWCYYVPLLRTRARSCLRVWGLIR